MHIAAVEADDQGQVRAGQRFPVSGAGVDEADAFVAEFGLQTLGGARGAASQRARLECSAERERVGQQVGGGAVGGQGGVSGLPVGQFRCSALGKELGQGAERDPFPAAGAGLGDRDFLWEVLGVSRNLAN